MNKLIRMNGKVNFLVKLIGLVNLVRLLITSFFTSFMLDKIVIRNVFC